MFYCTESALFLEEQTFFCFCNFYSFYSFSVLAHATSLPKVQAKNHESYNDPTDPVSALKISCVRNLALK